MIKPKTQAETGFFATSVSRNGHSNSSFSTTHSDEMGKNKGFHQSPIFCLQIVNGVFFENYLT